jgi:polyisoprenyl-teichoic acid--peptidoglycan teichoic acid transferase
VDTQHKDQGPRRARRSQYGPYRAGPSWPPPGGGPAGGGSGGRGRPVLAVLLAICILALGFAAYRASDLLQRVSGFTNPLQELQDTVAPPAGSVAWKLQHDQRVNLLLLGYGGAENDAPYLTDSMLVASIDPGQKRVMLVSVPRDLGVQIDAFKGQPPMVNKVNVAYSVGMQDSSYHGKKPQFTGGKDRGGLLAEQTVGSVTGLQFDGYLAVDFKAFRDLVDALGGVNVCLDEPLDDYQYPNYTDGYVGGGIHFKAGCQQVNGEQALELARSRHAVQADQASDFGRARRQQVLVNAIRKKATSVSAIGKAPQLMSALARDFSTNLSLTDIRALYDWGGKLPDSAIGRVAITNEDFLTDTTCAGDLGYQLCPVDGSGKMLRAYLSNLFVDPAALSEKAPVQVDNGSVSLTDLGQRVGRTLQPLGLRVSPTQRVRPLQQTVIYDYSGGRYPKTVHWLESYFGATVQQVSSATPPTPNPPTGGLVVVLGHDYAERWVGQ